MSGPTRRQLLAVPAIAAVVVAVAAGGYWATRQGQSNAHSSVSPILAFTVGTPGPTSSGSSSVAPPTAYPSPAALQTRAQNGASVQTIAYDPVRQMVWYVTYNDAGQPVLRGIATATGVIHDKRLPDDDAGYVREFGPLKVDPTGAVWLANYDRLLRYDPASDKLAGIVLATSVAGELPGATSGLNQGIRTSGLGFLDGLALLARVNIPWLTEYDSTLHEVGRIPVPTAYAGAKDLIATSSGTLLVLPSHDQCFSGGSPLLLIDSTGSVLGQVDAGGDRLYAMGSEILVSGGASGASVLAGTTVTPVLPSMGPQNCSGMGNLAAPDPRGGVTVFLRGGGAGGRSVLEHVVDQRVVSSVTFPPVDIISSAGGQPEASPLTTESFWVDSLATDATGVSWMGVGGSLESIHLP